MFESDKWMKEKGEFYWSARRLGAILFIDRERERGEIRVWSKWPWLLLMMMFLLCYIMFQLERVLFEWNTKTDRTETHRVLFRIIDLNTNHRLTFTRQSMIFIYFLLYNKIEYIFINKRFNYYLWFFFRIVYTGIGGPTFNLL